MQQSSPVSFSIKLRTPHHIASQLAVVLSLCTLTSLSAASLSADEQPASAVLRSASVELPETDAAQLIAVPLSAEVYQYARPDFSDLRLLDADSNEVPFLIRQRSTTETRSRKSTWKVADPRLQPLENEQLQIEFRLQKSDPQITAIRLESPLKNFEQQVEVWQIEDQSGATEPELLVSATIFDYSRYMDVRRLVIPLPTENQARGFRLVLKQLTQAQRSSLRFLTRKLQGDQETSREESFAIEDRVFRIDHIALISESAEDTITGVLNQEWQISAGAQSEDPENQQTLIEISSAGQPITQFQLQTDQTDFQRSASVQIRSADQEKWSTITTGSLQRFSFDGVDEERLTLTFPQQRDTLFRIVISNLDSQPLQLSSVRAFGPQQELVILARQQQPLTLQLGNPELLSPKYDLAAVNRLLDRSIQPVQATLGKLQAIGDVAVTAPPAAPLISSPLLWGPLLALLLALLARSLYSAGKQLTAEDHQNP